MKKRICLIMVMVALIVMAAGCGSNESAVDNGETLNVDTESVSIASSGEATKEEASEHVHNYNIIIYDTRPVSGEKLAEANDSGHPIQETETYIAGYKCECGAVEEFD
jgi:uncharacterized lipoprotein YehR (DUF1307 family)